MFQDLVRFYFTRCMVYVLFYNKRLIQFTAFISCRFSLPLGSRLNLVPGTIIFSRNVITSLASCTCVPMYSRHIIMYSLFYLPT